MEKPSKNLPPIEINWLTLDDFEYLCFNLARELMQYGEPIPDYSTRENNLLDSSLNSPKQTYSGQFLYPTFSKQASILFYSLIKNHPFKNGNKRIAVMALLSFLSINNQWMNVDPQTLYDIACRISESRPGEKDIILREIEELLNKNTFTIQNENSYQK